MSVAAAWRATSLWLATSTLWLAACAPTFVPPTAADGAAYFSLRDGGTLTWARDDGIDEVHAIAADASAPDGALRFSVVARANGFLVPARTRTFEVTADALALVRALDCVIDCDEPDAPLGLARWPLVAGDVVESAAQVKRTRGTEPPRTVAETDRTQVGTPIDVDVPAGHFQGAPLAWSRTLDGEAAAARAVVVEGEGIVALDDFDGAHLTLRARAP